MITLRIALSTTLAIYIDRLDMAQLFLDHAELNTTFKAQLDDQIIKALLRPHAPFCPTAFSSQGSDQVSRLIQLDQTH